jgi:hypothetical protein
LSKQKRLVRFGYLWYCYHYITIQAEAPLKGSYTCLSARAFLFCRKEVTDGQRKIEDSRCSDSCRYGINRLWSVENVAF